MRRNRLLPRCVVVCLAVGAAAHERPVIGAGDVGPECRDGACAAHCPVRPGQFGYYPTQWRRWPGAESARESPRREATPAPPARSLVPGADEESPRGREEPPAAGAAPSSDVSTAVAARLARLVAEADAARLAGAAEQREFTARLVAVMLTEHDPGARCTVLALAAGFDTPAAAAICAGALEDPDPRVRHAACRLYAERRAADGVARLAARARDDADLGVRLRAIRALGDMADPGAVPHLVALLDDPDPAVQSRATSALARATGRDFGADIDRWKRWAAAQPASPPRWSLGAAIQHLF